MFLNKKTGVICVVLSTLLMLTGCHPKVTPSTDMDKHLSCAELQAEIKTAEEVRAEIENSRGFSGRNVALALLFWPGVVINEVTGDKAETAATDRLAALKNIYAQQCSVKNDSKKSA